MSFWIPALMAGLGALGNLGKGKAQATDSITYNYDPLTQSFRDSLLNGFSGMLNDNGVFDRAYRAAGLNQLKQNSDNTLNAIDAALTARGIGRTTGGVSGLRDVLYDLGKQTANFENQATLDLAQRRQNLLSGAGSFLASLPINKTEIKTGQEGGGLLSQLLGGGAQGLAGWLGSYNATQNWDKINGPGGTANGGTGQPVFKF